MNNWLLYVLLTVVVLVNVYFTYRRSEGVDDTGRKLLGACQLLYLVFVVIAFAMSKVYNALGIGKVQADGASMPLLIGSVLVMLAVFAAFLFLKHKLEKKIREEHKL